MRVTLTVRNTSAVIANVRGAGSAARARAQELVRTYGELTKELTQFFCPVASGFMRDHVVTEYGPEGLSWETGWRAEDFAAAGLDFYPPFVEAGTSRAPAQPSLAPAYREVAPQFRADLAAALRESVRGARGVSR